MSDETKDEGCGEDPRAGWSAEDLYCGGPLVIDERIETDIRAGIEAIQARMDRELADSVFVLEWLMRERRSMTVSWSKPCDPLSWGDGVAIGSAEHPAGGPVPEDADISAEAVETVEIDLEDQGPRLADLLALVRPPDQTYSHNDVVCGRHERYDQWNKPLDQNGVLLISRRDTIIMALFDYATEDYAEILKRFSDPEFRAAHNLDKTPDFSAVTRDIARS